MIQAREYELTDDWGQPVVVQEECQFCERSIISRFGGAVGNECDACAAEMRLLNEAGKLEVENWSIRVVKIEEDL